MPVETRKRAVDAAASQDQTMAEWLTEAVNRKADQQAGNLVLPPGKPDKPEPAEPAPGIDLAGLGAAIQATVAAAAISGAKLPKGVAREAAATIRHAMRRARGLPDRQTKPRNGQTIQLIESSTQP